MPSQPFYWTYEPITNQYIMYYSYTSASNILQYNHSILYNLDYLDSLLSIQNNPLETKPKIVSHMPEWF